MKFFSNLNEKEIEQLFFKKPSSFNKYTSREQLAYGLGATLYMPATKPNIHQDILTKKHAGLTSLVICLEDAIGDDEVELAERLLVHELVTLHDGINRGFIQLEDLPLIFIRIRNREQLVCVAKEMGDAIQVITGVVIPKFNSVSSQYILEELVQMNKQYAPLYAMPILETKEIIYKETRMDELLQIKRLLDQYKPYILNVRIGATDFSGLFGIRRNSDTTVYDIAVIRDCIADIINMFVRLDSPYVVSGPVWEYFSSNERLLKPRIRETPFREKFGQEGVQWRKELIGNHMDGFIQEILKDIGNGIVGKTIIHPTHINHVQALNAVTYEEFIDARAIVDSNNGSLGVMKSSFSNKMNELKPHLYWANKILLKSEVYGVLRDEYTYIDLLKQESYVSNH